MKEGNSRHPVNIKAIGLMQHGNQKTYMFGVLWSDYNNVQIYRTFEDFKKFQKELKKKFPLESGILKRRERVLPKLKDVARTLRKKRFLERLRLLEAYSQALLNLDAGISQCESVVEFFTLQDCDLNPSFPEDSLVIMLPDKQEEEQVVKSQTLNISAPLKSNKYMCMAGYETVDLKNRPFTVEQYQFLDVLIKDTTGWWLVENGDQQLAWFPAPYLCSSKNTEEKDIAHEHLEEGIMFVVIKGHKAQNSDEISVGVGALVEVLKESDSGWWLIRYNGRTGFIPSIYLKVYSNRCEKIQHMLSRELNASTASLDKDRWFGDADSVLGDQRQSDRESSLSLGTKSLESEARADRDSDVNSVTGSDGILSSSNSMQSSQSTSNSSLSMTKSLRGMPNTPARSKPDEIIEGCSTSNGRLSSSNSMCSSQSTSNSSLSMTTSVHGMPNTPARSEPDEVIEEYGTSNVRLSSSSSMQSSQSTSNSSLSMTTSMHGVPYTPASSEPTEVIEECGTVIKALEDTMSWL
ncbi:NADPH oxidase organizer 1-like [Eleutherodactylus coqui]|uniref:NADPH oxidase organizer 1-like n=1 Tax=Eleutherodactylus coqui TaxID=57060 RepID=UPI003462BCF9